jgi:hypothetical protein
MIDIRIIALLAAIAVTALLQFGWATPWYIDVLVGVLTYLLARCVGWVIAEPRTIEKVKRRPF